MGLSVSRSTIMAVKSGLDNRHIKVAEMILPARDCRYGFREEHPCHRPIPRTSIPFPARLSRLPRPLFAGKKLASTNTSSHSRMPSSRVPHMRLLGGCLVPYVVLRQEDLDRARQEAGCFVLITNEPFEADGGISSFELLRLYKEQHSIERNFGFLKYPLSTPLPEISSAN